MSDVVERLWDFCNILRHDGINYGDYIEQLTYILFLKIADEKKLEIPDGCKWDDLLILSGTELLDAYNNALRELSKQKGILGDIFAGSLSRFRQPVHLKRLMNLVDETEWSALDIDIKADAYEGLLQKYASEQKGAGQYFTPRPAIKAIIECVKPDIRNKPKITIHDPALGTAGFLINSYEWMMSQTHDGADLSREDRLWLQKNTYSGVEIVLETRRLALMNLFLHEIEAEIFYTDSLADGPHTSKRYDFVLTNPPFGIKGGDYPTRRDFTVQTANKQLNFLQHIVTILKPGGEAAMVMPDNVLFDDHAGLEIRKNLLEDCNLHTILRLPIGTFTPYSAGVKANVLFFKKGVPTESIWLYDLRTNIKKINKSNPLIEDDFKEFIHNYGLSPRVGSDRFRSFSIEEIREEYGYNLDIVWMNGNSNQEEIIFDDPEDMLYNILDDLELLIKNVKDIIDGLKHDI